jgi:uncharacterized repeat protein (TIGR03803 family)
VVIDRAGDLYGTTAAGGGGSCNGQEGTGCGIAYELEPNGLFTTLWQFSGGPADGAGPTTALLGPTGERLYVITAGGGNSCDLRNYLNVPGCGTIVRLSPPATPPRTVKENQWIETILYKFQFSDGAAPAGNLAMDSAGNLYGATNLGGSAGTVFKLTSSHGNWSETLLHNFGPGDGEYPLSGVTFDAAGNLYGTTNSGGAFDFGAVFQLVAASGWSENILHNFTCGSDGCMPTAGVTLDSSGNLYGSTPGIECAGGGAGNAFELFTGSWSYNSLYCFVGGFGQGPLLSTMVFDQAGNLYGTTYAAGANGWGSVFKLTSSNGTWTYTSLHDFTGGSDGGNPVGNLVFDDNGNLYGTASCGGSTGTCGHQNDGYGVVFKIRGPLGSRRN